MKTKNIWPMGCIFCLTSLFCMGLTKEKKTSFSFAAIADCQYCAKPEKNGQRFYAQSKYKLKNCVEELNKRNDLEYAIHLGDFIEKDFDSFDVVNLIYNNLKTKTYHVLGNHDYDVADDKKKDVIAKLGMTSAYYDFVVENWRFIVLDGNDISFHAYPKGSKKYKESENYYQANKIQLPKWNGAIGKKQMSWLEETIIKAKENKESVVLYCHFPVYPKNNYNLWNSQEIIKLIEKYTCIKAYINGHNHKGDYALKNGVHYVTLKGMVYTNETAYSIITIDPTHIKIKGFGREKDRELLITKD